MGFFDHCYLDQRYGSEWITYRFGGSQLAIHDWDQRRTIVVSTSWPEGDKDFYIKTLHYLDDIPFDAVEIEVSKTGALLSTSSDTKRDSTTIPFYPSVEEFPPEFRKIRCPDLTEMDRLGIQVDLTTYESSSGETKQAAFKYYITEYNVALVWHEMNCTMRLPKHPNIVPFDSIVINTVGEKDVVVGFTTTFIPGGTISDNTSRVFKLKYLQQLIELIITYLNVIDFINLKLGIVHGDICPWNLLINSETDNIQIFDFNLAGKLGWEGDTEHGNIFKYDIARNDVKLVVFTLYEIITCDQHFREDYYPIKWDLSVVLEMDTWEQHADVQLDSPIADYRRFLEEWVSVRAKVEKEITHYTQTPEAFSWPPVPEFPLVLEYGSSIRLRGQLRQELVRKGEPFLEWQRPGSRQLPLPKNQCLLATGVILEDESSEEDEETMEDVSEGSSGNGKD